MQISEHELRGMTADLVDRHDATLPLMRDNLAEMVSNLREKGLGAPSRRNFLVGSGVVFGGFALAACGGSDKTDDDVDTGASASGSKKLEGDLIVVGLAAALEIGAVNTYQKVLDAAGSGAIKDVPPAVATFVQTAQKQHKDHADAWNGVLTGAGFAAIKDTSNLPSVEKLIGDRLMGVKDVGTAATLALDLENIAAATYFGGIGAISDPGGIKVAASILPVETQHAAILSYVLGKYPVPNTFITADGAVGPDAFVQK